VRAQDILPCIPPHPDAETKPDWPLTVVETEGRFHNQTQRAGKVYRLTFPQWFANAFLVLSGDLHMVLGCMFAKSTKAAEDLIDAHRR
jgi:hypothetical protein